MQRKLFSQYVSSSPICTSSDIKHLALVSRLCICVFLSLCVCVCLSVCMFVLILDHDDESFSGDLELWLPGRSV